LVQLSIDHNIRGLHATNILDDAIFNLWQEVKRNGDCRHQSY